MKKLLIALLTTLFLLSTNVVFGEDTNLLHDNANVLNNEERSRIESKLKAVSNKYGITLAVVIVDSIDNGSVEAYADDFYDEHFTNDNGALVLLGIQSRDWWVSTKGSGVVNLSDYEIDNVFYQYANEHLKNNDFGKAVEGFIDGLDYYFSYDDTADIEAQNNSTKQTPKFGMKNVAISAAISAIITLITAIILNNQLKSVKPQKFAGSYVKENSFILTGMSNLLVGSHTSKTPINRNNNQMHSGSNFGSGHSTHISSSGASHGGHGGHF